MNSLVLFVGLIVNMALAFLLSHAILPSLVHNVESPPSVMVLRRVLYPVAAISLVLALIAFGNAIYLAVGAIEFIYPRFLI